MSEREELERLRKLKRLRELEAKAAGGAPAQPAPFASPFLQRAAGMLPAGTQPVFPAGAMATEPQMRASLPGATGSDRMSNREDTQIMARAQRVAQAEAQAAQDARLGPVKAAGKTAAGAGACYSRCSGSAPSGIRPRQRHS